MLSITPGMTTGGNGQCVVFHVFVCFILKVLQDRFNLQIELGRSVTSSHAMGRNGPKGLSGSRVSILY